MEIYHMTFGQVYCLFFYDIGILITGQITVPTEPKLYRSSLKHILYLLPALYLIWSSGVKEISSK
jgi:hypothetical protein